jgi:DNA repair photolyase
VPDVAHLERDRWGSYVLVKTNLPRVLETELKRKPQRQVFCSSATDPYQPAEDRHEITRRCLELLVREDWPVRILTRSPLIRRDVDLLTELSEVSVGISIPTIDDEAREIVEPAAPPIEGRLASVRALDEAGLDPFVNLAPAYPLTGQCPDEIAKRFAAAGAHVVYGGPWRYLDDFLDRLHDRVQDTRLEAFVRAVQDEAYYERLFTQLEGAFRRVGIPFRRM